MRIESQLGDLLIEMLLREGYQRMSAENKNMLVTHLAEKYNMLLTDIDNKFILETVKSIKIEELSNKCQDVIEKGFVAKNGHEYRTNRDDQINMMGEKDRLDYDASVETVYWKTEDIGYILHTKDEWLEVYKSGLEFKREQLFRYNYLKTLVLNAKEESELLNISWDMPFGEPAIPTIPTVPTITEEEEVDTEEDTIE